MPRHGLRGQGGRFRKKGGPVGGPVGGGGGVQYPNGPPSINIKIPPPPKNPPPSSPQGGIGGGGGGQPALPSPSGPAPIHIHVPPPPKQPRRGAVPFGVAIAPGIPKAAGNAGLVMFLGLLVFLTCGWNLASPFLEVWLGKQSISQISNPLAIVGALTFIAITGVIASTGEDATSLMLLMWFAIWMVCIVLGHGMDNINAFLNLVKPSFAITSGAASTAGTTQAKVQGGKA